MESLPRISLLAAGLQLALLRILLLSALSSSAANASYEPKAVYAVPFITAKTSKFGLGIEGTSVDTAGRIYATAYSGGTTSGIGTIANPNGKVHQELFYKDQTGSQSFNGIRFLPLSEALSERFLSRAVATDVRGHQLLLLLQWKRDGRVRGSRFCGNESMLQPNDAAVATRSGRIYLSGANYGKVTTEVGDGDLWICEAPSSLSFFNSSNLQLGPVTAKRLGLFGLTNGIEVSPDESTLYLSESFHKNGEIVQNLVWKFAIDPRTGDVFNKTLVVDFQKLDGTGWVDLDGIRTDLDGNLFVVKNGPPSEVAVVKLSPEGKLLARIMAPGIKEATNCEFGGPDGTTLFVVGKCIDNPDKGCVDVWTGNSSPGRAWSELTSFSR